MKSMLAAPVALLVLMGAAGARDRVARCYLKVDGKVYLDKPCIFSAESDGSFSIGTAGENGTRRDRYFAYVNKNDDGTAEASWNAEPAGEHADDALGTVTRHGACWTNAKAQICAR